MKQVIDHTVYQLQIVTVKAGREEQFIYLSDHIQGKSYTEDMVFSRCYRAFSLFSGKPLNNSYILLSQWHSLELLERFNQQQTSGSLVQEWQQCFNITEQVIMKPEAGWDYQLDKVIDNAQTVEFGIRQIKPSKQSIFFERRQAFLSQIKSINPGVVFDYEMKSTEEDLNIILFGWQSKPHFHQASRRLLTSLKALIRMLRFFPLANMQAFKVGTLVEKK